MVSKNCLYFGVDVSSIWGDLPLVGEMMQFDGCIMVAYFSMTFLVQFEQ